MPASNSSVSLRFVQLPWPNIGGDLEKKCLCLLRPTEEDVEMEGPLEDLPVRVKEEPKVEVLLPTPTSGSGTGSLTDQVNAAIADLTAKFIANVAAVNRLTQELALAQAARVVDRAKITRLEAEVQSLLVQLGAANAAFGGAPLVSALASLGTLGVDMSAWTVEWNRLYEEAVLFRTANS